VQAWSRSQSHASRGFFGCRPVRAKLLGFAVVSEQLSDGIDFQNDTVSATLGAKVGTEAMAIVFAPTDDTN
jgi:hypothetical protein